MEYLLILRLRVMRQRKDVRKRDTLQLDPIMTVWEEGIVFPEYITGKVLY